MDLGNIFVVVFLVFYCKYFFVLLFDKNRRKELRRKNRSLDRLRKIPVKSLRDQKRFLNLKYPKKKKEKYTWKKFGVLLFTIILYVGLFFLFNWMFKILDVHVKLWMALLLMLIGPYVINKFLKKFNLEQNY